MQEFELLEHPADVGFRVRGRTLPDLFAKCAEALVSLILDPSQAQDAKRWSLSAQGSDTESLLVNWLNEVLYFVDAKRIVFSRFDVDLEANQVNAICYGESIDPIRHPSRVVVKAVTYHQLRVFESDHTRIAEVYVDV